MKEIKRLRDEMEKCMNQIKEIEEAAKAGEGMVILKEENIHHN